MDLSTLQAEAPAGLSFYAFKDEVLFWSNTLSQCGTIQAMKFIEEKFGNSLTTRTWKTVDKMLA